VRRLWLFALALTILLPLLGVMLALSAVSASQAQCAAGLAGAGGPVGGVPAADIPIFQGAAAEFTLGDRGPSILAAINYIESTFDTSTLPGVNSGTNRAGAAGPMQIGVNGTAGDTWDTSARAGRFAYVHQRGQDFADGIWVVNPLFIIDLVHEQLANHENDQPAREEAFFAGAGLDEDELRTARQEDRERRNAQRLRQAEATNSNLGLGHDLRAGLMDPTPGQLHALNAIICHLLARHYRDVIAYGAGWTDQDRQQPIGDTGRREPRQPDAILDAELERALNDPDPLRGIAQLTAGWAAAFALDPDGVTRTKTLGTERMARKLADALPGGHSPLRAAVWEFLRPMLSPRLATLHRDTFVFDEPLDTTVKLAAHRGESDLADLDLGDDAAAA
jgi:hypothetical protein